MELDAVLKIQDNLIDNRKILPISIDQLYKKARAFHKKLLMNSKFDISNDPNFEEELTFINKYEKSGEQNLDELVEQIRMMIILAEKENCQYSKIVDEI